MTIRSIVVSLQAEISGYSRNMAAAARQAQATAKAQTQAQARVRAARRLQDIAEKSGDQAAIARAKQRVKATQDQAAAAARQSAAARRAAAEEVARNRAVKEAQQKAGKAATAFGAVMAAGFVVSVEKAAEFEQAMSHVEAATHESAAAMEQLRNAALGAGARTSFTAKESANAIEEMAKAGVSTANILNGGLNGALDLAAAGTLGVAQAAEIAASTMVQFSLAGDQVGHIADVLAAGAGKAQGSVQDMGLALSYVGPVAASMGISMEETSGAIALMANNGIIAEKAGTGLRGVLAALVAPSMKAQGEISKLGITLYDSQGQFIGFRGVADQLNTALADASQEERNFALGTIFGNAQLVTATTLLKGGAAAVDEWTGKVDDQGYAAETARLKMNNLKGDVERLGGALDTALITGGTGGLAPLRELTQGITAVVNAYSRLPAASQQTVTGLTGAAGAAGLAAGGFLLLAPRIIATKAALSTLGTTMPNTTRAMKGLGAAAAGLVALTVVAGAIRSIQHATDETYPGVEALTNKLLGLSSASGTGALGKQFDDLGKSIDRIKDKNFDQYLGDFLQTPFEGLFGEGGGLREARSEIEALDEALSGLVGRAGPERASAAFLQLTKSLGLTGGQISNLRDLLPQYRDALSGVANNSKLAADSQGKVGAAAQVAGEAMEDERSAADRLKDALDALNGGAISVARAQIQFADAQKATRDAFKGSNDTLSVSNKKGREHLAQVLDLIEAAQSYGEAVAEEASSSMDANAAANAGRKAYRARIADLRETLLASGLTRKEVDRLIAKYGQVPPKIKSDVVLTGADAAAARVAALVDQLRQIPSQRSVAVAVNLTGNTNLAEVRRALGKAGHAAGGPVVGPGGPTEDAVPILASNGEYVVNAKSTARHRGLLEAINSGRFAAGGLVGFARGGRVSAADRIFAQIAGAAKPGLAAGATPEAVAAAAREVERLTKAWQAAVDAMRDAEERAKLVADVTRARRALGKAKPKDRAEAKRDLADAVKARNEFDRQARLTAQQRKVERKAEQLANAQERADAARRIADNKAAFEFDHKATAAQLADVDRRLVKEKQFSDTWVDLARQREQLAEQINETQRQAVQEAQQSFDEQLSRVNGYLDEQARITEQLAQAQGAYDGAVADANARLAEQTEQVKQTRREALAGWFDITQKAHVSGGSSANTLIRNAQGQVEQFREWMQRLSDARGRGLSEGVVSALGLDQGPEALGQLRKLSSATVDEVSTLNGLVAQQQALASDQTAREASGLLGEVGRELVAAQREASDAVTEARTAFLEAQRDLNGQMAEIGAQQGRTFSDAVAQGLASGIPAVAQAARDLQAAYSTLSAAQAVSAITVTVPVPPAPKAAAKPAAKPKKKAGGGLVTGPGGPTDDAVAAWLSDGEFVVNAKETARHRALLEAVNAGRFALGGYVSASRMPTNQGGGPMSVNVDNLGVQYEVRRATEAIQQQTAVMRRSDASRPLTGSLSGSW